MDSDKSADEQPKKRIARRVVTEKRQYFVPEHGVTVDATDVDDAVKKAKAKATQAEPKAETVEEGDV